jgi:hypothetical protein
MRSGAAETASSPPATPPQPAAAAPDRRPRPSLLDIVFVIWAVIIPIGFGYRLLNSDGDLARHLRLGRMMLDQGGLLHRDTFSHTAAGQPFLAFEWLSEIVYAGIERVAGLAGVAIFAGLLLALTFTLLCRFMLRQGADPFLAYLVTMGAAVLTGGHWLARPHLFTLLAVVLLMELLTRRRQTLWPYLLLFVVWSNFHGGFSYGFLLIGAFLAGEALEAWRGGDPEGAKAAVRTRGATLALAVAATLINPYGPALLQHVGGFFSSDFLRYTNEFLSPDFHTLNGKIFLAALIGVMAAFALVPRRPPYPWLFLILGNSAIALIAQRNIELFAMTALPLVALHVDPAWRRLRWNAPPRAVFEREHRGAYQGLAAGIVTALLVGVAAMKGEVGGVDVVPNRFDPDRFPVEVVDRGRAAGISGPIFNEFIWGGYLLYAWPEQRVFIDGGTDHYGDALFAEYIRAWNLDPGWRDVLAKYRIQWVLVDPRARVAHELVREGGWGIWYCDSVAVLLEHGGRGGGAAIADSLTRCSGAAAPRQTPE